jgi:hypothetical protein
VNIHINRNQIRSPQLITVAETLTRDNINISVFLDIMAIYFTLMMEAESSSETTIYQTTLRHISEDSRVWSRHCDCLKSRRVRCRGNRRRPLSHVSLLFAYINTVFPVTAAETKGQARNRDIYCPIRSEEGQGQKRTQV